jgi:hypothetical protein
VLGVICAWLFNFGRNAAAVAEMLNVVTLAPRKLVARLKRKIHPVFLAGLDQA